MEATPTLPEATDIVIVGGGVIGASIAYFLVTESEYDVTLVEKNAIGAGSTGDSSAIIRHHYGEKELYTELADWSHQFYQEFEDRVGEPIAYNENPRVTFAEEGSSDVEYAEAGYEILSELGIPVTRYDGDQLDEAFPMFNLEAFDFAVSDETAAYSDGTDVAAGFVRAAQHRGATVVTGVAVEGFETESGSVTAVQTDDGTVACDNVVLAAGPWTPALGEQLGLDVPITPSREQVLLLEPTAEYREQYPDLVPTAGLPGGCYIRSEFGEGVLIATHHSEEQCDPDHYEKRPDQETLLDLHETVAEYIPELSDAGIQGKYTGVYANTPDHDFILDHCGPDGCYLACGFSGHGFKQAPAVGKLMSDRITKGESELADLEFFSLSRFEDSAEGHGGGIEY
ncbi:FAD dependent oxidoreductase [Natronococcus amylolyticus DSM 10524]|uniref:FAD dependent oxidoreductase n=1 Tax=Natronococcus amylolyticus DSM 10524 TaxID=1227497 RepID=L9WZM6_9EURY|nr:FAD-binding oxidoreductase [Natronococcus amylolyticus]ELY54915.1 FAD dependent oxidoreductase [Natronococcus amylolyticus DSM 10524]